MQIRYFNLSVFIITILVLQLIINNSTILYIDCLTLILVYLLLEGAFPVRLILLVCVLADLFGHWYLGTHLLAITVISIPIKGLVNFYRISNVLQKIVLNAIFAFMAYTIISCIDISVHRASINWINTLIEVVLLNPIIFLLLSKFIIKLPSDIIRTE